MKRQGRLVGIALGIASSVIGHNQLTAGARDADYVLKYGVGFFGDIFKNVDKGTNLRAEITPERVSETGFDLVFRTWGDTRVARIRADWLAIGPVRDEDDWDLG